MRRLIAVCTCHARVYPKQDQAGGHKNGESRVQSVRDTWYKTWERFGDQIDLKFFYGRPANGQKPAPNEVFLDCGDDYYSLPEKVRKICEFAQSEYSNLFKLDDDVFCYVDRLLANFESTDYRGYLIESDIKYASGTAYWLSQRAMKLIAEAEIPAGEWREDLHVGRVLAHNGIELTHDERYHCCHCDHCMTLVPEFKRITSHTASPKRMYELMRK